MMQPGKWDLLSDPKDPVWDQFLEAAEVSAADREARAMIRPSEELSRDGDRWTWTHLSELWTYRFTFTLGEQVFTPLFTNGIQATSVFTEEDGKLIQSFESEGKKGTIVHEQTPEGMTAVHSIQGVTAVRRYKKVA
ncbi:lipocalin/fatty-acid binding family protein [Streptomyces sp. enrichment culture]|uniref:lipocalin/fatty-acid binding family protein n=1 Tax=Streptomyces sp. enrichment culture TaxID=1795815 RepID=UPI003F55DDC7